MDRVQLKNKSQGLDLTNYTVIIPSICVGNAAQLACDLLISSKGLERIGSLTSPALIPIYGPSAFQHDQTKAAACELYRNIEDKLVVVQFRAPFISKHAAGLHKSLVELVKGARRVCVLSGSFGFEKRVIESSPYAYLVSQSFKDAHSDQLEKVPWKEFTGNTVYGGGNCLQLFKALELDKVPVILLFRYLLEGDNTTDASLILRELNELRDFLQMPEGQMNLTVPKSWNLLFGNDVPDLIY